MKLHKESLGKIGAAFGIVLLTCAVAVGVTQARYNSAVSWTGVYAPGVQNISSDFLTQDGQTVVLQSWDAVPGTAYTESIRLFSGKGNVYVTAQCSADSNLVAAELDQSALYATEAGANVKLKLTVTENARQLTEITQTKVTVTAADATQSKVLKATYQVTLLPAGMEIPNPEMSDLQANLTVSPGQADRAFAWTEKLIFSLTAQSNADGIELMYNGDVFPKGTRYTVDREQYVLGNAMTIKIPISAGTPVPMSLDFSKTDAVLPQSVNITALAYFENKITDQISFTASPTRNPLGVDALDTEPVIHGMGGLTVSMTGDEDDLIILIQHLEKTDSGAIYVQSEELDVQIRPDRENDGQYLLEISNQDGRAPAGTYRLTLIRMCGEQLVSTCQMAFFVHY